MQTKHKNTLRIGLDLDQVLTNAFEKVLERFNHHFGVTVRLRDIEKHFYLEEFPIATLEERLQFLKPLYNDEEVNFHDAMPIESAPEYTRQLTLDGHTLFYISTRDKKLQEGTIAWLKRFNFPVDGVALYLRETLGEDGVSFKKRTIEMLKLNIYVEDDERVAQRLAIPVVLLDYPWNQQVQGDNIYRAKSWQEIYRLIKKISKKH